MSWLAEGSVVAGFRIEGVVGQGGMGVVYRAVQVSLDRPVALKLITPVLAADPGFRERFERESRLTASLDHPNVVPVYAAGEHAGALYIAMRFVDGTDLRALIKAEGRLEPERGARIVAHVASALDAAHEQGLVHRDVKPANVLISHRGGADHVYLTDFGLTKRSASSSGGPTASGEWVGTLDYVAPEQLRGERVDGRADVYSLGCVLYESLTGEVPYPRENELAKLWAHISDPPPSASELAREVSPALSAVAQTAMAKAPDERYPSAGALGRAAVAATSDGTSAPTRPVGQRLRRTAGGRRPPHRRRRRVVIAAAAALLLGGLVAAGVVLQDESEPERKRSVQARAAPPPPAGPLPIGPATGRLRQLGGTAGCIVGEALAGCAASRGFRGANDVAVSADGRFAYVASARSDVVAAFARDRSTGALRQLGGEGGCLGDRAGGPCSLARGLDGPRSVAISPDGRNVYVASSEAVAVLARNPRTGMLRQLFGSSGCVSRVRGFGCRAGRALPRPRRVTVSADGANVYVGGIGGVGVFARDASGDGALAQLSGRAGCVAESGEGCTIVPGIGGSVALAESPSGRQVYLAAAGGDRLVTMARARDGSLVRGSGGCLAQAPGSAGCSAARALRDPRAVVASADGASVYAASQRSDAIAILRRDDSTGVLTQPGGADGCVIQAGGGGCAEARALDGVTDIALSPDGRNLYAVTQKINAMSLFSRGTRRGLRRLPGAHGCFIRGGVLGCSAGRGLTSAEAITVSRDGRSVYVASKHRALGGIAVFRRSPR
jgi:DNA-binding beta-propeller fold protein YncE